MVDVALEERVVDERYRKVGSGNGKSQEQVRNLLVLVGPCGQILTKKSIKNTIIQSMLNMHLSFTFCQLS